MLGALAESGSLEEILEESSRFAGGLAERLRDRIYQNVVPTLAAGIVEARRLTKPTAKDLADTYEMTLAVLFRLLFIAYGEDKDLLPYRWNGLYRRRSLKDKYPRWPPEEPISAVTVKEGRACLVCEDHQGDPAKEFSEETYISTK